MCTYIISQKLKTECRKGSVNMKINMNEIAVDSGHGNKPMINATIYNVVDRNDLYSSVGAHHIPKKYDHLIYSLTAMKKQDYKNGLIYGWKTWGLKVTLADGFTCPELLPDTVVDGRYQYVIKPSGANLKRFLSKVVKEREVN